MKGWAWFVVVGFGCLVACACSAVTRTVGPGEDYWMIQMAIDDSSDGDIVQVLRGEYVENVVLKEGVDVVGAGAGETTIRSLSESFPFAGVVGKDNATLSGFTVTGGYYGIHCTGASPTITDCVVWRNAHCGILLESSLPQVTRCVVVQNPRYGVQCLDSSSPVMSNCTFSANGCGVSAASSAPLLSNCILWDNGDDLKGITEAVSVGHCDIEDGDFAGDNGNISANPAFVAWGSFNDSDSGLFVDVGYTGPEQGTQVNPFSSIKSALSGYSYHLGAGSPCLNAGAGGVHMGAFPDEQPTAPAGSERVVVNVAAGTYYEGRLFVCHGAAVRGSSSPPSRIVAYGDTVFYMLGESSVSNFIIAGGDDAVVCSFSESQIDRCVILECGQNAVYSFNSACSVQQCHMFYNSNAGILIDGGSGNLSDCYIGNHGTAGISCAGGSSVTIRNCLMTDSPLGLLCEGGADVRVHNSTISGNSWSGVESRDGASVSIVNSIVWGNAYGELSEEEGAIAAIYSDVAGGFPGEGNINATPLFEPGPLGSFYLDSDSPCLDKGNDSAENLGLDKRTTSPRSEPDTGVVDMGYHYERFRIRRIALSDGRVTLEWTSSPNLDYTILRASNLDIPWPYQSMANVTATWLQEAYSFDEPDAPAEFYRVSRP